VNTTDLNPSLQKRWSSILPPIRVLSAGSAGFLLWCSPEDHPVGYDILMYAGAFAKPCAYVGDIRWGWDDAEKITHLVIEPKFKDTCV
jgi:hypothetical protein